MVQDPAAHDRILPAACALTLLLAAAGCRQNQVSTGALSVDIAPLHLAQHLEAARLEGADLGAGAPESVEWTFDQPQPDWKPVGYASPTERLPDVAYLDDAVRLTISSAPLPQGWRLAHGGLYTEIHGWDFEDWAYVVVELRTADPIDHLELGFNLGRAEDDSAIRQPRPFEAYASEVPVIADGLTHTYALRLDRFEGNRPEGTWRELGIFLGADEPVTVDLVSVKVVPREADYASVPVGVHMTARDGEHRRSIFTHGRSRLEYPIEMPAQARLDLALGVLREDAPVTFRVTATVAPDRASTVLEETYADAAHWAPRSLDLSAWAGERVTLALETDAAAGTVALWGTPVLSGERHESRPNVIFYIIDGGGADYMSLFGYNRENTPNLARLADQGAVFERAYSTATWTKVSTASFMTSMPHSSLGGYRSDTDRVPDGAATMAELLHGKGYQAAIIVSNPYAASMSGLERGADFLHETGVEPNNSESSRLLHESFWRWRESQPAEPYWVHFQSTDIHEPFHPVAPYSGLYVDPALRRVYEEWDPKLYPGGGWRDPAAYREHGIDLARYSYAQQGLYDEAMAHNDARIGELVARLRERGEWERTLLVVAADHGYPAACHRLMEPLAPMWGPMFNPHETHVPMLFVWPGHVVPGRRFTEPVSMLDVLPTLLDMLDLPIPETAQGRSLAPFLLGQAELEPAPVFLEEFNVDRDSGELHGLIDVVDGWWGASLEIGEGSANDIGGVGARTEEHRPAPLLLYDLRNDPFTQHSLHRERPDLVERYTRLLQRELARNQRLGKALDSGGDVALDQEQLEALRALGYID